MKDAVLVRSSLRTWDLNLLSLLGLALLLGAVVAAVLGVDALAALLAAPGAAALVGSACGRRRRVRRRQWVEDTGAGFILSDRTGQRDIGDDQVLSMALIFKHNHENGQLKSVTRRFLVWLSSEDALPERLEMKNTIKVNQVDPLAELIRRLSDHLFEQAQEDLRAGRSVLGECWTIQGQELTIRQRRQVLNCRLEEVQAVSTVENHCCIWRRGQDAAWARVPMDSANAYLLGRLLAGQLAGRPADEGPPPEGQLGRIIFERKREKWLAVVLFLLAGICLAATIGFAAFIPQNEGFAIIALVFLVMTGLCGAGARYERRAVFRCHEFGVYQAGLFRTRTLRYADIEAFTYTATRHYYHGVYTNTVFQLVFDPVPEQKTQRIRYQVSLSHADQELDNLRDQISGMIASRMYQHLAAGEPVAWTQNLRFLPDGLEYQPTGLFGRKQATVFPYAEVLSHNLDQGNFFLWVRGKKKPAIQEKVSSRNFFPGYFLLLGVLQRRMAQNA